VTYKKGSANVGNVHVLNVCVGSRSKMPLVLSSTLDGGDHS